MQKNSMSGVIYKGSNAQLSVALFPRCYEVSGNISDVVLTFYTTIGGGAVIFSGETVTVSGSTAIVVFQPEQLELLDDGLLRYHVNLNDDGNPKVFNLDTSWFLKTPLPYEPIEVVTRDDVEEIVSEAISSVTKEYVEEIVESALTAVTEEVVEREVQEAMGDYYTSAQTEEKISQAIAAETARTEQTYLKEHQSLADYYTSGQTENAIQNAIAAETARTEQTYLKEHQSLEGYATENWVNEQGFLKEHQSLADYYTSGQTDSAISTAVQDKVSSTTIAQIWTGSQAQYDAMTGHSANVLYIINS